MYSIFFLVFGLHNIFHKGSYNTAMFLNTILTSWKMFLKLGTNTLH